MTATQEPGPVPALTSESSGAVGWQPYRYGESPQIRKDTRSRSGIIAVALGTLAFLMSLGSVLLAMVWSVRAAALVVAAIAAIVALGGVVCAVLALARTRMGTAAGVGVAVAGTSMSAAGFATALLWTVVLVLTSVAVPAAAADSAPTMPVPAPPAAPAVAPVAGAEREFRFEVTGTVGAAAISYHFAGTSGGDTVPTPVPWSKNVDGGDGDESFSINATSSPGRQGSLTCSISDAASGTVLDTKTVETDGSPQSTAYVDCHFYG